MDEDTNTEYILNDEVQNAVAVNDTCKHENMLHSIEIIEEIKKSDYFHMPLNLTAREYVFKWWKQRVFLSWRLRAWSIQ